MCSCPPTSSIRNSGKRRLCSSLEYPPPLRFSWPIDRGGEERGGYSGRGKADGCREQKLRRQLGYDCFLRNGNGVRFSRGRRLTNSRNDAQEIGTSGGLKLLGRTD